MYVGNFVAIDTTFLYIGWGKNQPTFPETKPSRALCVIARRYFPCLIAQNKSTAETMFCDAEYFYWDIEDCAIMSNKHPYVCERLADNIGMYTLVIT